MIVTVSRQVKSELLAMRPLCEAPSDIPCLAYGKRSLDPAESFEFFVGIISKEGRPPSVSPLIIFEIDGTEVALQCPEETHVSGELHFDYRGERIVNVK
jgi:hypothetical protein